jgi:hypothetical protein
MGKGLLESRIHHPMQNTHPHPDAGDRAPSRPPLHGVDNALT